MFGTKLCPGRIYGCISHSGTLHAWPNGGRRRQVRASPRVSYFFLPKTCFATPKKVLGEKKKVISKSFQ
jgi:hypothetical protein